MMLQPYLQRVLPKPLSTVVWMLYVWVGLVWLGFGRRVVYLVGSVLAGSWFILAGLHFVVEAHGDNRFFTWGWQTFLATILLLVVMDVVFSDETLRSIRRKQVAERL